MEHHARSGLNKQVHEEACTWFIECRSGDLDASARREFDRWLRKSPEHLSAYLEIAAIWNEGPALDAQRRWDSATLVADATAGHDNVIALAEPARAETPSGTVDATAAPLAAATPGKSSGFAAQRRRLLIAASIASLGLGTLIWSQAFRAPTYATALGEQRSIVLTDGSTVDLNSRSKVKIRYSQQQRAVELLEGQALFRVAKDAARPFTVASDRALVRAVGTQFDVYKRRNGTVVTVVEGRVAVLTGQSATGSANPPPGAARPPAAKRSLPATSAADGLVLAAGEQATVTADIATKTAHPNVASATAWTERRLIFDSTSLSEVAEEFNRYNTRQLVIEDDALRALHVSGVFSSTDPSSLVRFLLERGAVQVIETPAEIRVASKVVRSGN